MADSVVVILRVTVIHRAEHGDYFQISAGCTIDE